MQHPLRGGNLATQIKGVWTLFVRTRSQTRCLARESPAPDDRDVWETKIAMKQFDVEKGADKGIEKVLGTSIEVF